METNLQTHEVHSPSFFELPGLYGESDNLDECMGEAGPPWVTLPESRVWLQV